MYVCVAAAAVNRRSISLSFLNKKLNLISFTQRMRIFSPTMIAVVVFFL